MINKFMNFIDNHNCTYIVLNFSRKKIVYANKKAAQMYKVTCETGNIEPIFGDNMVGLDRMITKEMKEPYKDEVIINDVVTTLSNGKRLLADVRLGYFHKDDDEIYIEIVPAKGSPIVVIRKILDHSSKPTLLLELDEQLTINYCSEKTKEDYNINDEKSFSKIFPPSKRDKILKEIHTTFADENNEVYYKHLRLMNSKGENAWYSINLEKVDFGKDGKKLICFLNYIQEQVERTSVLENINLYFNALQALSNDTLFIIDINNKTLTYRDQHTKEGNNKIIQNFPENPEIKSFIYKDDIEKHNKFAKSVLKGESGEEIIRIMLPDGNLKYSKYVWTPLKNSDGEVREVFGKMIDINELIEAQSQLDDVNQYFNILQEMSSGLLYRFDIKTRTLYRSEETAKVFKGPRITENFPSNEWLNKVMHPDDIKDYINFINLVAEGIDGTQTSRLIMPHGEYEYYNFSFKALRNSDGEIKEMVGYAKNIHNIVKTEEELVNMNQYFKIIQMQTECLILRYDIKNRILHRNTEVAKESGLPPFTEDYPNDKEMNRVVHLEDVEGYKAFFDRAVAGEEGVYNARLLTVAGTHEHHSITMRAIRNSDGSIHEMLLILTNIHELVEKENELDDLNRQFDALQELSDDLLFRVDIENRKFIRRNSDSSTFGIVKEEMDFPQEVLESNRIHPEDVSIYEDFVAHALCAIAGSIEVRMRENQEEYRYCRLTWIPVENRDGKVTEVVGKIVDVQIVKDLEEQAKYDSLTKALNKRTMLESTSKILLRSNKNDKHALFFMDLDDFKYVNDNLGHAFGDYLLGELGRRLNDGVRLDDLVGRVGGDEFIIFLRDVPNYEMLMGKAKMLLSTISEDFVDGDIRHTIHGSLGIAVYPDHGTTYEELYHHADLALYRSKGGGKNTVTMFTDEMSD